MTKAEWAARIPHIKRAVAHAGETRRNVRAKVWHDNEKFLLQPGVYKQNGLEMKCFPPNSCDLNPIETCWAQLRRDLALREFQDLRLGKSLTIAQYRQRASKILQSYAQPKPGHKLSYLQKLVHGMPARLHRCVVNKYGNCGK